MTKMYFAFLAYILPLVNLEFQAESFRIHTLKKSISNGIKAVMNNFIKKELLKSIDFDKIDVGSPSNYVTLNNVYFGATAESILVKNGDKICPNKLTDFRVKVLNVYVCK